MMTLPQNPWFQDWIFTDTLPAPAVDYFLHDVNYKNAALTYQTYGCINLANEIRNFKSKAINVYREIAEALEKVDNLPDFVPQNKINLTEKEIKAFTGHYVYINNKTSPVKMVKVKGHLAWYADNSKDTMHIYFKDPNTAYDQVAEIHFKIEEEEVTGFLVEMKGTGDKYQYEKID